MPGSSEIAPPSPPNGRRGPYRPSRAWRALLLLGCAVFSLSTARAADDDQLDRLKVALRDSVSALRDAQDENAQLTAKQTELTAQLAAKQQEIDKLKAQAAGSAATASQTTAAEAATKQLQDQLDQAQVALKKWQDGYDQAATIARAKNAEAHDLGQRYNRAAGQLSQCSAMNDKLESLGNEMLGKIGRCSFGDFLGSHEPVTQIYKARMEQLKEGYASTLRDQKFPPN